MVVLHRRVLDSRRAPDGVGSRGIGRGFAPVFAAIALKPNMAGSDRRPSAFTVFFALPLMWLVLWAAGKAHPRSPPGKTTDRPFGTGRFFLRGGSGVVALVDQIHHRGQRHVARELRAALGHFVGGPVVRRKIQRFIALGFGIHRGVHLMNASFQLSPDQLFGDALSLLATRTAHTC